MLVLMAREPKIEVPAGKSPKLPKPEIKAVSINSQRHEITTRAVEAHAQETFGSAEKAEHWLNTNSVFRGKTPRQVAKVDPSWVEIALVRINHGDYS